MPPLKAFRAGDIFNDAFKAHGIPLAPMPVAINSTEYRGRPACVNCGWCHVGCAIGAHASPLVSHLRDARKHGAEVRPFSYVTRVLTNPAATASPASNTTTPRRSSTSSLPASSCSPPMPPRSRG